MSNQLITDCQGDTKDSCDDIASWECYDNVVRHDCCQTCEDNVVSPAVPGCEFGDKVDQCDVDNGRRCYIYNISKDCCSTCEGYETSIPGCRYGDKIENCKRNDCYTYSDKRRADCCLTCANTSTTRASSSSGTWSTQWQTITTTGSTTDRPVTTVTSKSSGAAGWAVPVAASAGGVVVILIVVLVIVLLRRKRKPEHLSPITDKMYNDYKMSKRAPLAPPRHPSTEKGWVEGKDETAEYAYISPDYVEGPQSNERRNGNDPLPPTPGEYLDLSDAKTDSYGYSPDKNITHDNLNNERTPSDNLTPGTRHAEQTPGGNLTPGTRHAERAHSNKYEQLPHLPTYVNKPEDGQASHKL